MIALRYPAGSVATISYAPGGHPGTEKERIEILGRGRSAVISDFRHVVLDGRTEAAKGGKGHLAEGQAFHRAVHAVEAESTYAFLASTRTSLLAAGDLFGNSADYSL